MALSKIDPDQFILNGVEGLPDRREKGCGGYGAMYEVRLNGAPCIAKRVHDILVSRGQHEPVSEEGRSDTLRWFREECILLSGLRHPNIVQMLGVHCDGSDEADISLIMEYMHMDLRYCMYTYPDIPLPYKTSILRDVAYGLAYLHSCNIMHCDINAGKILLTESLKAKIADFALAQLFNRETVMMEQIKCPGTLDYMPPECLVNSPKYDKRLDIFSFGHLAIYLVNQEPPLTLHSTITAADVQKKQVQVAKRRRALDQMGGSHHPLYATVVQCLSDTSDQRPTSRDVVKRMEEICKQHSILHKNTLETLTVLTEKQKLVTTPRELQAAKDHQIVELMAKMKANNYELQAKHHEVERLQNKLTIIQSKVS